MPTPKRSAKKSTKKSAKNSTKKETRKRGGDQTLRPDARKALREVRQILAQIGKANVQAEIKKVDSYLTALDIHTSFNF
jgi:hypothetical protein